MKRLSVGACAIVVAVLTSPSFAAKRKPVAAPKPFPWISLFDGKSLKGWQKTKFGGEGAVKIKNGAVILEVGSDMTGIHTKRKLPRINYEVQLEAQRVDGSDFFCGLTFPIGKEYASLIIGGWGGGVCGISSIGGNDASENQTTTYRKFKKGKWYPVRLKVTETKLEAWLDGKKIVDVNTKGLKFTVRIEVEDSRPFGFSTWQTTGALRNIRLRRVPAPAKPAKGQ